MNGCRVYIHFPVFNQTKHINKNCLIKWDVWYYMQANGKWKSVMLRALAILNICYMESLINMLYKCFWGIDVNLIQKNYQSFSDIWPNMSLWNLVFVFALAIGASQGFTVPTCSQIATMSTAISRVLRGSALLPGALRLGKFKVFFDVG